VLCREDDVLQQFGGANGGGGGVVGRAVDVVVDNVAGEGFGALLKLLRRGGRYVSSGAIAGADVALDMRDLYLKDLTLLGCTAWSEAVFPNVVGYIARGEIRPLLAGTFALQDIALAQQAFLDKHHVGNLVLVPPGTLQFGNL
jgi:NADPH:quinone reductase-like Zn-dependent oxidoreductase